MKLEIHSRFAAVKRVTAKSKKNLLAGNVKEILEMQWSRKKMYAMKWKQ